MHAYLWRTIGALLLSTLVSCGGLDRNEIPEPDKPAPPQPEQIAITFMPSQIAFSDEGGSQLISIKVQGGDGIWQAAARDEDVWISVQVVKPSASDGQLKITALPNKVAASRRAVVTLTSSKQTQQIIVSQNAAGSLLITKNHYDIPETGATIDVEVKHDVEFETRIPETFATWILPATAKQLTATIRSFLVKPNTDKVSREGYVEIASKLGIEHVTILQAHASTTDPTPDPDPTQPDKIEVMPAAVSVPHIGGQSKIAVSASASFTASITLDDQWLRVVSTTENELTLEATANATPQKRLAQVTLNCGQASAVVTLTQEGAPPPADEADITISAPGTLEISEEQLATLISLKLSGPLNDKDFGLLGQIVRLKNLDLTGVTTPTLSSQAYAVAKKVETLVLPAAFKIIPAGAFSGFQMLKKLTVGAGVEIIEDNAFSSCMALTEVAFAPGSKLRELGGSVFMGCRKLATVSLPHGLESAGSSVFAGCSALKSLVLPQTLRELGMSAFTSCTSLASMTIPEGVSELGASTFTNCSALRTVRLPASISRLGNGAFGGCRGMVEIACGAVEPPELEGSAVFMSVGKGCTLRVPTGSGDKYRTAEGWGEVFVGRVVEGM